MRLVWNVRQVAQWVHIKPNKGPTQAEMDEDHLFLCVMDCTIPPLATDELVG